MSEMVAELASRVTLSDPLPTRCAACFASPSGQRFVNFDAAIDRGAIVEAGSMAVIDSIDELHVCEDCMRAGAEQLEFKPELHARQFREINRLKAQRDYHRGAEERAVQELERLRGEVRRLEAASDAPARPTFRKPR